MGEIAVRLVTLPLAPWAIVQGRRVRSRMPPMCAAAGEPRGTVEAGGSPLRLLVLGESTVAGCGIDSQDEALGAQPLRALLGLRAWWLDRAAARLAATDPRAVYVPIRIRGDLRHLFAADGFHPSAAGDAVWGAALAGAAARLVSA